jgi:hypothetical protein
MVRGDKQVDVVFWLVIGGMTLALLIEGGVLALMWFGIL